MIENKHLRSYLHVLDLGSFSKAAVYLNIAQPALSQHVRKLEDILGVVLLKRSARGVVPTHAGRQFAKRARQILEIVESTELQFRANPKAIFGEVRLGLPGSVCAVLATQILTEANDRFPSIKLILSELMSGDLADLLREGRMDLAILFNVTENADFTSEPLLRESLHLAGPPSDPILCDATIPAEKVVELPLVGTRPPHGLRLVIDRWATEFGKSLQYNFEVDAPSVLVKIATEGIAYSILSPFAIQRNVASGLMASSKIVDPAIERTACLCRSKRLPADIARDAIYSLVREIMRSTANREQRDELS